MYNIVVIKKKELVKIIIIYYQNIINIYNKLY